MTSNLTLTLSGLRKVNTYGIQNRINDLTEHLGRTPSDDEPLPVLSVWMALPSTMTGDVFDMLCAAEPKEEASRVSVTVAARAADRVAHLLPDPTAARAAACAAKAATSTFGVAALVAREAVEAAARASADSAALAVIRAKREAEDAAISAADAADAAIDAEAYNVSENARAAARETADTARAAARKTYDAYCAAQVNADSLFGLTYAATRADLIALLST